MKPVEVVVQEYIEVDQLDHISLKDGELIELTVPELLVIEPIKKVVHIETISNNFTHNPSILSAQKAYVYFEENGLQFRLYLSENPTVLCKRIS